ncbi:hypothetical protein Nepgr_002588 [Nepenthes gracilis]|uniref:Uncharacterized protein n=1 Tax=Nepenthes gracilis TaxID=150966 RepID=A0AAD3P6J6_NEPGR|nr:hypothetical protein Nepgr_002588 [Nepenthes gracilis]
MLVWSFSRLNSLQGEGQFAEMVGFGLLWLASGRHCSEKWPATPSIHHRQPTSSAKTAQPLSAEAKYRVHHQNIADSISTSLLHHGQQLKFIYHSVEPALLHSKRDETIAQWHHTWKTISQQQPTAKRRLGTKHRHQHNKSAILQQGT